MESKIKYLINVLTISGLLVFLTSCEKENLVPLNKEDEHAILSSSYSRDAVEGENNTESNEIGSSDDEADFNGEKDLSIGSSDDEADFNGEKDLSIGSSDDEADFNGEKDLSIGSSDDEADFNGEKDLSIGSSDDEADFNGEKDLSIAPPNSQKPAKDIHILEEPLSSDN